MNWGIHTPLGKAPPMESATGVLGRRENSKLEKHRRISEAARAVFTEFGYKGANMREIAKRAGVATGTLFLYAPDKRNLLLWMVNEDLDRVTDTAHAEILAGRAPNDLLEQLIYMFEPRYRYWAVDPELSLQALQHLVIQRDVQGPSAPDYALHPQQRFVMQENIRELVIAQQKHGRIRPNIDPDAVARLVLAIFNAAVRTWLRRSNTDVAEGIAELRVLLSLAIDGCAAPTARGAGETSD
jgi:AcrR family transcriptional regulator